MIQVATRGDRLEVAFCAPWDAPAHELFVRTKALPEHRLTYDECADVYRVETSARFASLLGLAAVEEPAELEIRPRLPLRDYQEHFLARALAAERFGLWFDTGLGKTAVMWTWAVTVLARTGGRVLVIAPLNLIRQHLAELERFFPGAECQVLDSREGLREWCGSGEPGLAIVNPEKFIPRDGIEKLPEVAQLAGVALDESSILKTGGGKIKWALIKSCRGVRYKLSLSATPAPNDPMEYASQASWLEMIRSEGDVIWTYFQRDPDTGEWYLKPHARRPFYRYLSAWACYVRNPVDLGFADWLSSVPPLERIVEEVEPTPEQLALVGQVDGIERQIGLFSGPSMGLEDRSRLSQIASGFLYVDGETQRVPSRKLDRSLEIIAAEVATGTSVIAWTHYDATSDAVREYLEAAGIAAAYITGATSRDERQRQLDAFLAGRLQVLVSRPRMLGYGANLQVASAMVFVDLTDSYEQVYQAERRAWRMGQTLPVRAYYPVVPRIESAVWLNLEAKRRQLEGDLGEMARAFREVADAS